MCSVTHSPFLLKLSFVSRYWNLGQKNARVLAKVIFRKRSGFQGFHRTLLSLMWIGYIHHSAILFVHVLICSEIGLNAKAEFSNKIMLCRLCNHFSHFTEAYIVVYYRLATAAGSVKFGARADSSQDTKFLQAVVGVVGR